MLFGLFGGRCDALPWPSSERSPFARPVPPLNVAAATGRCNVTQLMRIVVGGKVVRHRDWD
jgi:hypothetical protein